MLKIKKILPVVISVISITFLWELIRIILVNLFGNQELFFPSSFKIIGTFFNLFIKLDGWLPILNTFLKSFISLLLVTIISIPVAYFISKKKQLYALMRPAWDFFRSIPPAMLFPLFLVIIGIGDSTKIVIAVYFSFLILSLNLSDSFIAIFNEDNQIWKIMEINSTDRFKYQIFPQILDSFFSNLRIVGSIIIALIVISEMYIGRETGIGKAISIARDNYDWSSFYSYIIMTGTLGMLLNYLIDRLYKIFGTK
jgi:NitT/TauT family transport system permease protein